MNATEIGIITSLQAQVVSIAAEREEWARQRDRLRIKLAALRAAAKEADAEYEKYRGEGIGRSGDAPSWVYALRAALAASEEE